MNTTRLAGIYQNLEDLQKNDVIRIFYGQTHLFLGNSCNQFVHEKLLYYDCLNLSNNSIDSFYIRLPVTKLGNIDDELAELLNLNQ